MKKIKIFVLIAIMILVFGVSFYCFLVKSQELKQSDQIACPEDAKICPDGTAVGRVGPICQFAECPATSSQEEIKKEEAPPIDQNNQEIGVKTYSNKIYGFSFDYPADWEFIEMTNLIIFEKIGGTLKGSGDIFAFPIIIQKQDNPNQLSAEQWLLKKQKESGLLAESIIPININGVLGIRFFDISIEGEKYDAIYLRQEKFLYELVYNTGVYSSEYLAIFEKIISTFQFID